MNTLPETIGGYQHLEPDVVTESGDIGVMYGKPVSFVRFIGFHVGDIERITGENIYRKMPVAKQYEPL